MPGEPLGDLAASGAGFFGKVPARGDFVTRRLPREFVDPWDQWLQDVVANSREQLGEEWLDLYLTAPIWRFALSAEVCGAPATIGVLMPSVDSVGRFFPLTIALPGTNWPGPAVLARAAEPWFERAEDLALSALADDCDFDKFDGAVAGLERPPSMVRSSAGPEPKHDAYGRAAGLHFEGGLGAYPGLIDAVLKQQFPRYCLWWTSGSPQVGPSLLVSPGLPPLGAFAAFLHGRWAEHGWTEGHAALSNQAQRA